MDHGIYFPNLRNFFSWYYLP